LPQNELRIIICFPVVPFVHGGAEKAVLHLQEELIKRNHKAQLVGIPFTWNPPFKILDCALSWKLLDLKKSEGKETDLIISTKFPSWVVDHPNHVTWMFHQHRQAYDLQNTKFDDFNYHPDGEFVRKKIIELDNRYLKKVKKIFTISKNVSKRLMQFNQIKSEPLYIPVSNSSKFHNKEYGDYVLFPSRISPLKRQDLLVEAMKYTKSDIKCKIIGFDDHKKWLDDKMKDSHLAHKVELITGVSDDELVDLYSKALAVAYVPYDEDYGFVTLEAFYSKKPVLTASDSGGPLEFVKDGVNGFVSNPDPKKIALKLDEFYNNIENTKKMGNSGLKTVTDLNLNWDTVIEKLIS